MKSDSLSSRSPVNQKTT